MPGASTKLQGREAEAVAKRVLEQFGTFMRTDRAGEKGEGIWALGASPADVASEPAHPEAARVDDKAQAPAFSSPKTRSIPVN